MKSTNGLRSHAAWITFVAAVVTTGVGAYAIIVDGVRHIVVPVGCALWIVFLIVSIRDQITTRQDAFEAAQREVLDRLVDDAEVIQLRMADLHGRFDKLFEAIQEYGDQRQIAGHLASIRQPKADDTGRIVGKTFAGASSNVRSLPAR